jgi:hypothetical protein
MAGDEIRVLCDNLESLAGIVCKSVWQYASISVSLSALMLLFSLGRSRDSFLFMNISCWLGRAKDVIFTFHLWRKNNK